PAGACLALRPVSPHGAAGSPGPLEVEVRYTLSADDALRIDYEAETDRPTVVNLTHHGYFNLAGAGARDVYDHEIMIAADAFTPVDATLIPTGEMRAVAGTPFDLRAPAPIGARIADGDAALRAVGGFDHNFVLGTTRAAAPRLAAELCDLARGRTMTVLTTEPGLQFYTGNFLDGGHGRGAGLCLET